MLPQGIFSVAIATVLFPTLVPPRGARRHGRLPQHPRRSGCGRSRSCSSRRASSARCSRSRSSASSSSAARSRPTRRRSSPPASPRSRAGLVFNGAMLMLNRAFFSLQSNWIPTLVALGEPRPERRPRRRLLPVRHVGHPARDGARATSPGRAALALPAAPPARPARARAIRSAVVRDRRRVGRVAGVVAYAVWRRSTPRSGGRSPAQIVSLVPRARRGGARLLAACRVLRVREIAVATLLAEPLPSG